MALRRLSSDKMASDQTHDFICSTCNEDGLNIEAKYVCKECRTCYCDNCVLHHNKLFRTHSVLGRQDVSKWVGYAGLNPIEMCDKHDGKKLELLCEDHDELACNICVSVTHRMCQSIKHIPDLANGLKNQTDYKRMPIDLQTMNSRLQEFITKQKQNKQSIQENGKKILEEIRSLRKKMNEKFDELEKRTNDKVNDQLDKERNNLQEDINKCTQNKKKMEYYEATIQSKQDNNTSYIAFKKGKDKMREAESLLQQLSSRPHATLSFQADTRIDQFLSGLQTLGKIINTSSREIPVKSDFYNPNYFHTGNIRCEPVVYNGVFYK
ncbi:hypothetical protein MAR_025742 [Mya arenaria]|uniref:B box-type domain-containing protein n=1 Tax=Mya arenaria TaxID=6604 RepID=A0ABY7ERI3_MYAAR|nr:zinc-binding protein A33-like [Mya arenaria]WAR11562.1 hypothetical protein MAR_025742 [Mya arenaria]